jgi:hypothetical protein
MKAYTPPEDIITWDPGENFGNWDYQAKAQMEAYEVLLQYC